MKQKKNLNIVIDPDSIPVKPYEPIPHEKFTVPDELQGVEKLKKKGISLNFRDGLRLAERFINKWLGSLVGNNPSPIPNVPTFNLAYLVIIAVLIFFLLIK